MRIETVQMKRILGVLLIILLGGILCAQQYKPKTKCYIGGGLENYSSGNWHGGVFSPYVNLTKGRKSFNAGAIIQHRSTQVSGGKLSFSYNLSGKKTQAHEVDEDGDEGELEAAQDYVAVAKPALLQLNVFCFGQYFHNAPLSAAAVDTETKAANENQINWNHARLSTVEGGFGFELYVRFTSRISWKNFVAGSVYYHTNYINGMYHERMSPVLLLGTGIHICPL